MDKTQDAEISNFMVYLWTIPYSTLIKVSQYLEWLYLAHERKMTI